jgi:hypothetical protein
MEHEKHLHDDEESEELDTSEKTDEVIFDDEPESTTESAKNQNKSHKKGSKVEFKFSMSRAAIISLIVLVVLAIGGVVGWKYNLFSKATSWYSAATVTAKVIEKDSNKVLDGVTINIDGTIAKTDVSGFVSFKNLSSGDVTITVSKEGYIPSTYTTKLYRGNNPLPDIILEKAPDKLYTLAGTITDALNGGFIAKARAKVGDIEAVSDEKGAFTMQVKADASKISITKDGYSDAVATAVFNSNQLFDAIKSEMFPKLNIVFEQEKSGKVDIYQAGADGQNVTALTDGKQVYSSKSPMVSPDSTKLIFLSDKDNANASTNSSSFKLYQRDSKGNITKLSDDNNPYHVQWLNNDTIIYTYYAQTSPSQTVVVSYNVGNNKRVVLTKLPGADTTISVNIDGLAVSPNGQYIAWTQSAYTNNSAPTADITTLTNDTKGLFISKSDGTDYKRLSATSTYAYNMYFTANSADLHFSFYENNGYIYKSISIASGQESNSTKSILDRDYSRNVGYDGPYDYNGPSTVLTKDSKYVYIDTRNGRTDVFVAGTDGKNETQITKLGNVKGIHLSADEKYLLIGTNSDNITSMYISGLNSGTPKKAVECFSQNSGFLK